MSACYRCSDAGIETLGAERWISGSYRCADHGIHWAWCGIDRLVWQFWLVPGTLPGRRGRLSAMLDDIARR